MEKLEFEINYTIETVEKLYDEARKQLQKLKFEYEGLEVNHTVSDKDKCSWSIRIAIKKNKSLYCYGNTVAICLVDLIVHVLRYIADPSIAESQFSADDSN